MAIDFGSSATANIDIHYGNVLDNPGALSIAMWFRLNANDGADDEIMSHMNGAADGWLLRMTGSNGIRFRTDDGGSIEEDSATDTFTVGTWTHLGFTWSGTAVNFYQDGVVDSGGQLAHTQATTSVSETLTVGKKINGSAPMSWAHLLIWDSNVLHGGIVAAMQGALVDTDNLKVWVRADGTPSFNSIDGTAGTVGEGTPASLAEHLAHGGRGVPGFQDLFFDSGPRIARQEVRLVPEPQSIRVFESVTTDGTSSESVVIPEPNGLTTTWTKGYSAITTDWKKGDNSYV